MLLRTFLSNNDYLFISMASFWQCQDYLTNTSFGIYASPSLDNMAPTPLILPCDWLESGGSCSSANDFQSNHLDLTATHLPSGSLSLAGLGIRNATLADNMQSDDCSLPHVAGNSVDDRTLQVDTEDLHGEFEAFSPYLPHDVFASCDTWMQPCSSSEGNLGFSSSWSFSSVLKAAELASSHTLQPDSSFSTGPDSEVSSSTNCTDTEARDFSLSFEELSATTGLSVADFAAQISATAEATLRTMTAHGLTAEKLDCREAHDPFMFQSNLGDNNPRWFTRDLFLPGGDTDLRNVTPPWPCAGVNPADILPSQSPLPEVSVHSPGLGVLGQPFPDIFAGESAANSLSDVLPNFQPLLLHMDKIASFESELGYPFSNLTPRLQEDSRQLSDDEHSLFQSPSSSEYSPSMRPAEQKRIIGPRNDRRRVPRNRVQDDPITRSPEPSSHCDQIELPLNLGTPVFDAHRGVDIEVLKAKAERYRLRNQGRDYDKRWLISFAGKLSPKGELVDEFRCYVTGCKQTNKRRDHILIHVGAHLDQRPFKCMHW